MTTILVQTTMRPTNQLAQWEWIEAYIDGTLPPGEQPLFDQELRRDDAFRHDTEAMEQAKKALTTLALEQRVRQTVQQESSVARRTGAWLRPRRWAVAMGVVALLGVGYLTFSRVDLAAYRNDLTLTERYRQTPDNQPDEVLTPAQRTFYRQFFDAQAFLANGQPQQAITTLQTLAAVEGIRPYFRDAVYWHLLNAYLLAHQPNNAEATYRVLIQQSASPYPISTTDRWKVWWKIRWQQLSV